MSYSYALPGERFSSGLSRRWLVACTLSQLICLGALEAGGVLAQRMQWLTGSPEKIALDLVTAAIFGFTYGYLRGNVLRTGLARFPMALWCLVAAALALVFTPPVPEFAINFLLASGASAAARVLSPFAINGLIYGLVVGGLEALVMRRAAFGLTLWVLASGFAWALAHVTTTLGITLTSEWMMPKLGYAGTTFLWSLIAAPIAAALMLPALRNLTPQLSYYGPRVFRPLFQRDR
jgi:hypothetical protein